MFNFEINDYDKYVYQKELRDFLPDEIIDFHTHLSKKSFGRRGNSNGGSTWTRLVYDEQTAEDLSNAYKDMFPGKKVTPLIFGGCLCNIEKANDYVFEAGNEFGWRTLYRTSYDMSADELEENVKKGGFWGLKPYLSKLQRN